MVAREVKPIGSGQRHPPKGQLTWIALGAIALFVVMLVLVIARPVVNRHDGPETRPTTGSEPSIDPRSGG